MPSWSRGPRRPHQPDAGLGADGGLDPLRDDIRLPGRDASCAQGEDLIRACGELGAAYRSGLFEACETAHRAS